MDDLKATPLWAAFAAKATDEQRVIVSKMAHRAADRLDRVIETFPNYTLHNRVHALNVVKRMGDLLGPQLEEISSLEGAFLILSAYLHDIGMVFTNEERASIASEDRFPDFLKAHPQEEIRLASWRRDHPSELNAVPAQVAESYCRWGHAERVHRYLADVEGKDLLWDGQDIREKLGRVCESHNFDLDRLSKTDLPHLYQGEADLLFCAILLRLADILDFDNSRTPDEVYRYLDLAQPRNEAEEKSNTEWRKHLASGGFVFPAARGDRYALAFKATSDHPAVEYDLREFLSVIEREMRGCNSLLMHCIEKWRKLDLPFSIEQDDITSKGYKYGEHRFTLEQGQILDLLMGENIYEDPYVFVRELIQNAIDTTRHRQFYEQTRGPAYKPQPIQLSSWEDRDGYQWMRIDDYGMGMDENLIVKYLLKVGASYYRSDEFQAELLHYDSAGKSFVPISRFGIGLLSCFIASDQLELSTWRISADQGSGPLRLSMHALRGFFTMHLKSNPYHTPANMPNRAGKEEKYRAAHGTGIAVRLAANRDQSQFDLQKIVEKCVLHPPVPIEIHGRPIGGDYERLIARPWLSEPIDVPFNADAVAEVGRTLNVKIEAVPRLRIVPLDLTKYSDTPNLAGQAILLYVAGIPDEWRRGTPRDGERREMEVSLSTRQEPYISMTYRNEPEMERLRIHDNWGIESRVREFERSAGDLVRKLRDDGVDVYPFEGEWAMDYELLERELQKAADILARLPGVARTLRARAAVSNDLEEVLSSKTGSLADELLRRIDNENLTRLVAKYVQTGSEDELQRITDTSARFFQLRDELRAVVAARRRFVEEAGQAFRRTSFVIPSPDNTILPTGHAESTERNKPGRWLSHNGIHIPTAPSAFRVKSPVTGSWFAIHLALRDGLRPDLSLSRDDLRGLSWETYSRLALALSRALRDAVPDAPYDLRIFEDSLKKKSTDLEQIRSSGSIGDAWLDEPVIATETDGLLSLRQLGDRVRSGRNVVLKPPVGLQQWYHGAPNFISCCVATLLQTGIPVYVTQSGSFATKPAAESPVIQDGQLLFPPLFFVEYEDDERLRRSIHERDYSKLELPVNLCHPLAQWLVANARQIRDKHPGLFESLRVTVSSVRPAAELAELMNSLLARLRFLEPTLVPDGLEVSQEHFRFV